MAKTGTQTGTQTGTKTGFQALISAIQRDEDGLSVVIPADWMQGRTTYGGLSAALCLEAALTAIDAPPPLRSAQISFIGPAGGPVRLRARLLRQGKSVTFVEADVEGEKGLATRAVFAFGASRESRFDDDFTPAPTANGASISPPDECPVFIPQGMGPPFAQHYESKLAFGARPLMGSTENDHYIWTRHRDPDAASVTALLALADMPPPAVMPMFKEPAMISSMTWMLNFTKAAPETRDGWWLLQSRAENAAEGYSSQDMLVWNRDLELVIAGRQSVAVFA